MFELIKRMLKWIIIAVLIIILIIFIVGLVKKTDSPKKNLNPGVQTIKSGERNNTIIVNDNNDNETVVDTDSNDNDDPYTAELPDTASAADGIFAIIGIVIVGSGFYFIYKNNKVAE